MKRICSVEGCDEATARLVVAQEQAHGRFVEVEERGGRWYVSVYLADTDLELAPAAPAWLREVWERET